MPRLAACSECPRKVHARGFCITHYFRWRRHGDPNYVGSKRIPDEEVWKHIKRNRQGCWVWQGRKNNRGYGVLGRRRYAHIVAYVLTFGEIPAGMEIDHLCFNPACIKPRHLEAVTSAENMRRRRLLVRGRCKRGHQIKGEADVYLRKDNGRVMCLMCQRQREAARHA